MLLTKQSKQTSFSFSMEKIMLRCLDKKYSLNLSAWSGEKNSTSIEQKSEIIGTISKPSIFKTTHKNVS